MHKEAIQFIMSMSFCFILFFKEKTILDVGGGDINGNNRRFFSDCEYVCNDVIPSPNVNYISRTKDLPFNANYFDTIVSTECFEHDPEYKESFLKIYNLLKPNGLFLFTCASTGRPEHGTRKSKPHQSYGTIAGIDDMQDYYKNIDEQDLNDILPLNELFAVYRTYYNSFSKDLYFFGIKNGDNDIKIKEQYGNIEYIEENVSDTTVNTMAKN
jgi:SAM-dependent methyltransferase